MLFLKLALLNIRKYKRRSIIIVISVVLSVSVMVFVGGMLDGLKNSFFTNLLQQSGHLQIHEDGWKQRLDPYSIRYLIDQPDSVMKSIRATLPTTGQGGGRIRRMESILQFGALLIHNGKSIAMVGQGVKPDTAFFSRVTTHVVEGSFLPAAHSGIALSASSARLLDLKLGDQLAVLVQDSTGSPYYLTYPVTGIYHSGVSEMDDSYFFLTLSDAQELLDLPNKATEIRITLNDPASASSVANRLSPILGPKKLSIETWRQINGSIIVFIDMSDWFTLIINVFIIIVSATVITNSILMTVLERIPVFGTLRAIGLKRSQLFLMIVDEGLMLGTIGSLIGIALSVPFVVYLQSHGLNVGAISTALGTGTTYYFSMTPRNGLLDFAGGVLIAVAGSLYAAMVSVRRTLIESLSQEA
ncbi:MAG TPA: FtsX-like permease family protein [Spirochaetia bacterium]|nr:FtsX-like permease family protein [Spirochaetia bacterium]